MARTTTHDSFDDAARVVRNLNRTVPDEVGKATEQNLQAVASSGQASAYGAPARVARYVAPTIRVEGDQVRAGGGNPTSGGGTASDVLWGSMLGSSRYRQFPSRVGWADAYYLLDDWTAWEQGEGPYGDREQQALSTALRRA